MKTKKYLFKKHTNIKYLLTSYDVVSIYNNSLRLIECWCSSVLIVKRPMQKSSYVHISYVGISKEMKIVENYEMKLVVLT